MSDPIPSDLECRRLANAMAAGSGVRLDKMPEEDRAAFVKHANSALLYLGMRGEIAADHLAERLDAIVKASRIAAAQADADPNAQIGEEAIKALYASAADAEVIARILRGLAPAEEAISVFEPEAPKGSDAWPEVWDRVDGEPEETV